MYFFFHFFRYNNFFTNSNYDYARIRYYSIFLKNNTFVISLLTFHDYLLSLFFLKIYKNIIKNGNLNYTKISSLEKKQTNILLDKIRILLRWFFYFIDFLNFLVFDINFLKLANLSYFFKFSAYSRISLESFGLTLDLLNKDYTIDKIYFNKAVADNIYTNTLSILIMRRYTMVASPLFDDVEFRYKIPSDMYSLIVEDIQNQRILYSIYTMFRHYKKNINSFFFKNYMIYLYFKYSLYRLKRLSQFPTVFIKRLRLFSGFSKIGKTSLRKSKLAYNVKSVHERSYKPWRVFFIDSHLRSVGFNNYVDFSYSSNNVYLFRDMSLDQNLYIDLNIPVWSFHIFYFKGKSFNYTLNFRNKFLLDLNKLNSFFDNFFDIGKLRLLFRTILLYYSIFLDKQLWLTKGWFSFISYKEKFSTKVLKFLVKSYNYVKSGIKSGSRALHSDMYNYLRTRGINFMPYSSIELSFFKLRRRILFIKYGLRGNIKKKLIKFFTFDTQNDFYLDLCRLSNFFVFKKITDMPYSFKYSSILSNLSITFLSKCFNTTYAFCLFFLRRFFNLKPRFKKKKKLVNIRNLNISDKVTVLSYNKQFYKKERVIFYSKFLHFDSLNTSRTYQTLYFLFKSVNYVHRNYVYYNFGSRDDVFRVTKYYSFKDTALRDDFFYTLTYERRAVFFTSFYTFKDYTYYFYKFYRFFFNYNIYNNRVSFFFRILFTFNFFKLLSSFCYSLNFFKFFFKNFLFLSFCKNFRFIRLLI